MIKRTFVVGMIMLGFLIASMNIVTAVYSETIDDEPGDVVDYYTEESVSGKDNIDIKELTCSRDYRRVTLTLKVYGAIEDNGDINIWRLLVDEAYLEQITAGLTDEEAIALIEQMYSSWDTIISYIFYVENSVHQYTIIYVNQDSLIFNEEGKFIEGTASANDDTLTISFNLLTSKENVTTAIIEAQEQLFSELEETVFSDETIAYLNDPLPVGDDGDGGDDDNGSPGFELIVVIFAITIGVTLLRKKRTG